MIQIQELSFGYNRKFNVLNSLNLQLETGNIYGLLGKNGAGKSTLLKIMSGLLFPKKGKITVHHEIPQNRYPQFLQELYMLTEEFKLPAISIHKYIKLYSPFYPRFNHDQLDGYLKEFGLNKQKKLSEISYGEKKKFLLSFGLATDCKLLILDEPTNGLDIPSKSQFRKVVANAMYEDRTFIISTHQARDMDHLIDPIIILDEGEVVFFQEYENIARKLTVSKQKTVDPNDAAIYVESTFGGHTVVKPNTLEEEAHINLELLFNAVVHNKEGIHQIFQPKS